MEQKGAQMGKKTDQRVAKAELRAFKAEEAHADRYVSVNLILDRKHGTVQMDHPFCTPPEAYGLIAAAERMMAEGFAPYDPSEDADD